MKTRWIAHFHILGLSLSRQDVPCIGVKDQKVYDVSAHAAVDGVRIGMESGKAERLVPRALVVPFEEDAHERAATAVSDTFWQATPWVERYGVREWFVAVPHTSFEDAVEEVHQLLQKLMERFEGLELLIWAGMGPHRLAARAASLLLADGQGDRLTPERIIRLDRAAFLPVTDASRFVPQLPIRFLWPLPLKTRATLRQLGVLQIYQLRHVPEHQLIRKFGHEALLWLPYAKGEDSSRIVANYPSASRTVRWKAVDGWITPAQMPTVLDVLCERMSKVLMRGEEGCLRIELRIGQEGHPGLHFERKFTRPTWDSSTLLTHLTQALGSTRPGELVWINELSLSVFELRPLDQQPLFLDLWGSERKPSAQALDRLMIQWSSKHPRNPIRRGLVLSTREIRLTWFDRARGGGL